MRLERYLIEKAGEGGAKAGMLEIVQTSLEDARAFIDALFQKKGTSLDAEMPHFDMAFEKFEQS